MRNLKKFLALVLSVMMVMSLFITASAKSIDKDGKEQSFTDTADAEFTTAIEVLNGMDVLKGRADANGKVLGFFPDEKITRAEVAALVFRLSTGLTDADAANHYAQFGNFSDVPKDAWYAGYVGYCANAGYIKGYDPGEGGRFGPRDYVTGYQAAAMILRAMGYGVNGEFEGGNWALNVASIGTQNGILKTVNSTHFGNATLYEYAPRQVVAEIFFQAARTNCVVYTPAFGYQTTDINGQVYTTNWHTDNGLTANTSLGRRYFGLNSTTRVILGNQATGEDCTVLGANYNDPTLVGERYAYPGSVLEYEADGTTPKTYAKNGLELNVVTPIDWFGHKVTAYYNVNNGRTYAIYDEAKETYVYSADGKITGAGAKLGGLANSAGFAVNNAQGGAYISDRYSWISTGRSPVAASFKAIAVGSDVDQLDNASKVPATAVASNITEDYAANGLPYGNDDATTTTDQNGKEPGSYYKLINNGGGLDVVITEALELERVTEHNTTAAVKTYRLSGMSDGAMTYSPIKPSTFGLNDDGYIRMDSVVDGSKTDIGALVVGHEIKGTAYTVDYSGTIIKTDAKQYTYWLQPVETKVTGTVKYYNADTGEVTLATASGDKTLKWTRLPVINAVAAPASDGHDASVYFYNGQQYTFDIDPTDSSRYVNFTQGNDYEFLYTTYGDYSLGNLGTAELGYYVTGVNWNGDIVENKLVKTIDKFAANGANYELLTITKKNLGSANGLGWTIGNEIMNGYYTGYGYNAGTNDLDTRDAGAINLGADNWAGHSQSNQYWDGKLISDTGLTKTPLDITDGVWTVNKGNVADGWAEVTNVGAAGAVGELLLTPNTKFIIVDGIGIKGSANGLTVDIRNGISGLLGSYNSVTIDVKRFDIADNQQPDYNVYYKLAKEQYNNWYKDDNDLKYSDDNNMVSTVILPKAAISWSDNANLWFTNKTTYNGIYLGGQDAHDNIEQLTMWRNGTQEKVFVDTSKGSLAGNPIVDDARYGMFYNLTEIYKIGSTPIYQADRMTDPAMANVYATSNSATICNLDLAADYTATNDIATIRLSQRGRYTNGSFVVGDEINVYNVLNANVTNCTTGGTITNVRELKNAVSVGYRVTMAIVNDGHAISQIYVTEIEAPGTW